jgi:hypothetical protein
VIRAAMSWAELKAAATSRARDFWDIVRREDAATQAPERIASQWGRLNLQSVVRHVPRGAAFVHCPECRWPVNPGRTHMLLGAEQRTEATEEQMGRICQGVREQFALS